LVNGDAQQLKQGWSKFTFTVLQASLTLKSLNDNILNFAHIGIKLGYAS